MNLAIHTGSQALALLAADDFLEQWQLLYNECPWATAFQHADFVTPWYEHYQSRFLPVVVAGYAEDQSLTGLLTLGYREDEKLLVAAGERQAEYHAWLEKPEGKCQFIQATLKKLRDHFPGTDLRMKYLPPDTPLDWMTQARNEPRLFALRSHRRPIMDIEAESMDRQRRKKNQRQNFNRLQRSGEVNFERVASHDKFIQIFDELCTQYDFRQGALHHYMPFASDPAKKPFYIELHRRGILHTCILSVGGRIAASHSGVMSKGSAVHLGINTHAPAMAAHSPGNLLLAMLGVYLVEEKLPMLDLTPGGDGYKENFATRHDAVHELTMYGSLFRRWQSEAVASAKQHIKSRMRKAGLSTADAWAMLGKLKKFRRLGLRAYVSSIREIAQPATRHYRYRPELTVPVAGRVRIEKNSIRDILLFDDGGSSVERWEFMRKAMDRMERSMDVFSHANEGRLLMTCWVRQEIVAPAQEATERRGEAGRTVTLFDLYVHPSVTDEGLIRQVIAHILSEVKKTPDEPSIYFNGALDGALRSAMMKCGFEDELEKHGTQLQRSMTLNTEIQNISTGT